MKTAKPVFVLPQAERDLRETTAHSRTEGGEPLSVKWAEAVVASLQHIGQHPQAGSVRYAVTLNLAGLRFRPVKKFPYLVFYVEREMRVDVWRILHAQRDIPAWMTPSDQNEEH